MLTEGKSVQETYQNDIKEYIGEDSFSTLATPTLLACGNVPLSHKRTADNYIIIKRLYKSQTLKSCILNSEINLLKKYNLKELSQLTIKEVNREILMLQEYSFSDDINLKTDFDNIIQIRAKELRYILSSKHAMYSMEINNGFRALERYFEEITKFYNLPR